VCGRDRECRGAPWPDGDCNATESRGFVSKALRVQPHNGHMPHALGYSTRVRAYRDRGIVVGVLCALVFGLLTPAAAQERSPVLPNEGHSLEPWEHEDHG